MHLKKIKIRVSFHAGILRFVPEGLSRFGGHVIIGKSKKVKENFHEIDERSDYGIGTEPLCRKIGTWTDYIFSGIQTPFYARIQCREKVDGDLSCGGIRPTHDRQQADRTGQCALEKRVRRRNVGIGRYQKRSEKRIKRNEKAELGQFDCVLRPVLSFLFVLFYFEHVAHATTS